MITLTQLFILLGITWASAYMRARVGTSLIIAGLSLIGMTYLSELSILPWLLYSVVAILYFADDLRKDKITRPIFNLFKKVLPPMNQTEQEALEAGDVWWDGELFKGNPDWKQLLDYKKPALTEEERSFIDNQVETVCSMVSDWDVNFKDKDLPKPVWDYLKKEGFWGLIIPKSYGGKEFSALAHSTIVSKLSAHNCALGVTTMVPNSLGPAELLLHYGTEEQKNYYLPRLAKGDEIPCFALTAPQAGSDAGAIPDTGIICKGSYKGKQTLGIKLNWNKRYITLAPVATVLGLAFKLYDPDNLIGDKKDIGITVALIPTEHEGVEIGERHHPMGQAFMNGPTRGKDVFIPLDWIVGGSEYAGKGWRMLVECLSAGRGVSLPSSATATGKVAFKATGAYSVVREQFKTEIGRFEGVEEALARIAGKTYQLEATRVLTANAVDLGSKPSVITAIAKYHMTEAAREVVQDSMDIHGGRGVIMGESNYIANGYMSMPISITVEGANILTRNLMIFGQGAVRCHPFVFREMQAAHNSNEEAGVNEFDSLFFRHVGYALSNFIRTFSLSATSALIVKKPVKGKIGRYYQHLTRMSSALALVSDLSMALLGGELKRKERLSARLGDVLSYLYLSSAVLKYFHDNGSKSSDIPYVEWNLQNNLHNIQEAFNQFFDNLKPGWIGKALKWIVFPYGSHFKTASDKLDHQVVQPMLELSEVRDRLCADIYIGDETKPLGRIENAFHLVLETRDIARKLKKAIRAGDVIVQSELTATLDLAVKHKILTRQEADDYLAAENARLDAIQVDEYPADYITGKNMSVNSSKKEAKQSAKSGKATAKAKSGKTTGKPKAA
ncbi:MAG: acyl-CoA dehydrogenase [Gammaproteobacteria bacterium]|nr:acyl-CoA dehydrogenase [Gammaproteobacteria bacterium]